MITSCKNNLVVVQPKGGLDLQNGAVLWQALCDICPKRYSCWVIDLTHVDFINSAGLGALLNGLSLASEKQCRLALHNLHPSVKLVLEITRLDELFEVVDTVEPYQEFAPDLDRSAGMIQAA